MTIIINGLLLEFENSSRRRVHLKDMIISLFRPVKIKKERQIGLRIDGLTIDNGERVGILGGNGAGKSTLLKCLSGVYSPKCDVFLIDGFIAPLIEIGSGFHPELSGYDNIILNLSIAGHTQNMNENIRSIINFSELNDSINVPVKYYSTGMNLRLGFAIASQLNPDILIIDEFLAGGDQSFIEKSKSKIVDMIRNSRILIMVSHDLNHIREYCKRVIVLKRGEIVFDGEVDSGIKYYVNSL